jgi:hypothetical protein
MGSGRGKKEYGNRVGSGNGKEIRNIVILSIRSTVLVQYKERKDS